jgi:hypothetical protein
MEEQRRDVMTYTKQQILDAFVDVELETEGYNNQGFYMCSEQRLRYVLVTLDMSPENLRDGGQLELGQDESNRFYDCIEFYQNGEEFIAKNPERLQELMDMDFEALEEYVCRNNYDWTGDDFDHMEEYLVFVSEMQDEWQFIRGEVCNDSEYMEIIKQPWIRDKVKGYKSDNRFELAYLILLENAVITAETRERLDAVGVV